MTNNVTIKAPDHNHGSVLVKITGQPDLHLQPGQETTSSVYPGKTITIDEGIANLKDQPAAETGAGSAGTPGDEQVAS